MEHIAKACQRVVRKSNATGLRDVFAANEYQAALRAFEAACSAADDHTAKPVALHLVEDRDRARARLNQTMDQARGAATN